MNKSYQLIILDRDGVINQDSDEYVKSATEWHAIPGSLEAIAQLNQAGLKVVVCTNQSGIARGLFDLDTLNNIHRKMEDELATASGRLDHIYFCPHGPDDNCECRKPKPGMYRQAMSDFDVEPSRTLVIGDALRDLQAADTSGCDAALVLTGKGKKTESQLSMQQPNIIANNLAAMVKQLISHE